MKPTAPPAGRKDAMHVFFYTALFLITVLLLTRGVGRALGRAVQAHRLKVQWIQALEQSDVPRVEAVREEWKRLEGLQAESPLYGVVGTCLLLAGGVLLGAGLYVRFGTLAVGAYVGGTMTLAAGVVCLAVGIVGRALTRPPDSEA